jgi:hypothetical protein
VVIDVKNASRYNFSPVILFSFLFLRWDLHVQKKYSMCLKRGFENGARTSLFRLVRVPKLFKEIKCIKFLQESIYALTNSFKYITYQYSGTQSHVTTFVYHLLKTILNILFRRAMYRDFVHYTINNIQSHTIK